MIYLDASAIITLIAGRTHARELRDFLAAKPTMPMGTSTLGFVETVRTLDQLGNYPSAMADLVAGLTEILVTEEVRDAAARLPTGVRTLDAVHIASAQILEDALDVLVTYDKRMYEVAHSLGMPVAAPGASTHG
ncbi:type II toxin-antitoxin system VapC family toxin [Natronosporangium hydrolyticum]|uniref:Ribonuclease VapC n=1 Tax=Natronosporangium hydrolyticum TaxID=2811111 RepID=A0A895YGD2_9ACTN|nr:type II toxin-antitoxin system VapC family toxin [Natronosporangium hydrolyticum]QSB15135.1 type II toxin-antitoxin system VapC family toxin [Natronosporangium hydrolyticum]